MKIEVKTERLTGATRGRWTQENTLTETEADRHIQTEELRQIQRHIRTDKQTLIAHAYVIIYVNSPAAAPTFTDNLI